MSTQIALFDLGPDLAELRERRESLMRASKAPNTNKAYAHAVKQFDRWCANAGRSALPASEETVSLFVTWAISRWRLATVRLMLAAITVQHELQAFASPVTPTIRALVKNAARVKREKQGGKAALMPAQLRRLCRGLDTTETIDIRDRAMILLQFACGWRSAEVVSLDLANVRFTSAGLAVTLGASKTDQDGSEGRYVGLPKGQHELTCPVRALRAWVNVRGSEEGPLFCRINFPSGRVFAHRRLHPKVVRARLQLALEKIGEPANAYGSHSLRSGMVTTCIERGESELAIIQRTGHKNLETLKKYVRPAQAFRRDLLAGVL